MAGEQAPGSGLAGANRENQLMLTMAGMMNKLNDLSDNIRSMSNGEYGSVPDRMKTQLETTLKEIESIKKLTEGL